MMEPRSSLRMDVLFAKLTADLANMWKGKDQRALTIEDFFLDFDVADTEEIEEPSELDLALLRQMTATPKERRHG